MALYRLSIKLCSEHITTKVSYILRTGKYAKGTKSEELRESHSDNLPTWTHGKPLKFWKAIEDGEKPGQVQARTIELALPIELSPAQQREIVEEFCESSLANHAYTWAIHDAKSGRNPHVHICFSERLIDNRPEPKADEYCKQRKGYSKDRKITGKNRKQWLQDTRKNWEVIQNNALEKAGYQVRVSCLSLEDQGEEREPEIHVGAKETERYRRTGKKGERYKKNEAIKSRNLALEKLKTDLASEEAQLEKEKQEYEKLQKEKLEAEAKEAKRLEELNERYRRLLARNNAGKDGANARSDRKATTGKGGEGHSDIESKIRDAEAALEAGRAAINGTAADRRKYANAVGDARFANKQREREKEQREQAARTKTENREDAERDRPPVKTEQRSKSRGRSR